MSDFLHKLEVRTRQQRKDFDRFLRDHGWDDLADEHAAKLREIDSGVYGARSTWAALSAAQRLALQMMQERGANAARMHSNTAYTLAGAHPEPVGSRATIRNLILRGLLDCEGGAFDPEAVVSLSERARFVLKHGPHPRD